jgi:hypothetical protein
MANNYPDPGLYNDETIEAQRREKAGAWSLYAESGPAFDPDGDYLCGTCEMRAGTDSCLTVGRKGEGPISFTTGTCRIYRRGDPLQIDPLPKKLSKSDALYAERPNVKGFGCKRCEYGAPANFPDPDGRPSWCVQWGMHVLPNACCDKNEGPDDVVPYEVTAIARSLGESIVRSRLAKNLHRIPGLTPEQYMRLLDDEVQKALAFPEYEAEVPGESSDVFPSDTGLEGPDFTAPPGAGVGI